MNSFEMGASPVPGGYIGWIKRVHQSEPDTIKAKGGQPIIYTNRADALQAAGAHLTSYLNGSIVSDRPARESPKAAAEQIFRKGKIIKVERK